MSETATGATGAWSYRAGAWFAVFGSKVTVLLPESQKDQVVALWALVDGGAGFDEVLDGLLASGLSKLPGFVLVSSDAGPTRVLLRGQGVLATLTADGEETTLDGAAGHTWVERSVEHVTALSITVPDAEVEGPTADFPVVTGLVRVSRIDRPPFATAAYGSASPVDPVAADPEMLEPDPAARVAEEPVALEEAAEVHEPAEPDGLVPDHDDGPATEVMPSIGGDPLTDPLPPEVPAGAAPAGWVTPWDTPAPPPSPAAAAAEAEAEPMAHQTPEQAADDAEDQADQAADDQAEDEGAAEDQAQDHLSDDTPAAPPPTFPPADSSADTTPPGWVPPPPPSEPGVNDAPPLPIGSWEPLGGNFAPPPTPADVDHDGLTVAGGSAPPAPAAPGIPGQPAAPAVTHPVAKLVISDGQTVVVDRAVLIGRAPEARRFTSTEQPQLVTVPSRLHEISSTHVEVRPGTGADHGTAVVTDMGSTNGTVLVQPGLGPEDLKPGIAVQLIPGAIINLGDGITIQVTRP